LKHTQIVVASLLVPKQDKLIFYKKRITKRHFPQRIMLRNTHTHTHTLYDNQLETHKDSVMSLLSWFIGKSANY